MTIDLEGLLASIKMFGALNSSMMLTALLWFISDLEAHPIAGIIKRGIDSGSGKLVAKRNENLCLFLCSQGKGMNLCACHINPLPGKRTVDMSNTAKSSRICKKRINSGAYTPNGMLKEALKNSKNMEGKAGDKVLFSEKDEPNQLPEKYLYNDQEVDDSQTKSMESAVSKNKIYEELEKLKLLSRLARRLLSQYLASNTPKPSTED